MDAARFDTLVRSLTDSRPRRGVLAASLGGVLGLLGLAHPNTGEAKKKKPCPPCKKRKHGKCKKNKPDGTTCRGGTCQSGRCTTPPCANGIKDGSESDVDCGGTCSRCATTKRCASRNDCASALCTSSTCTACVVNEDCGSDGNGACTCDETDTGERFCHTYEGIHAVASCDQCPVGTSCFPKIIGGLLLCLHPCGVA